MSFSDYLENKVLDHVLGGSDYTRPASVYIALCTTAPTDASTGSTLVEPSGGSYARATVTNNSTNFPAAASGAKANGTLIAFAQATGDWGTITHAAVVDAITAGNVLAWGAVTVSKEINNGDTASFPIGALSFTVN